MVYLGNFNDTQVAVKMLSKSSLQRDKELQAEVTSLPTSDTRARVNISYEIKIKSHVHAYLLLGVHHQNLTLLREITYSINYNTVTLTIDITSITTIYISSKLKSNVSKLTTNSNTIIFSTNYNFNIINHIHDKRTTLSLK